MIISCNGVILMVDSMRSRSEASGINLPFDAGRHSSRFDEYRFQSLRARAPGQKFSALAAQRGLVISNYLMVRELNSTSDINYPVSKRQAPKGQARVRSHVTWPYGVLIFCLIASLRWGHLLCVAQVTAIKETLAKQEAWQTYYPSTEELVVLLDRGAAEADALFMVEVDVRGTKLSAWAYLDPAQRQPGATLPLLQDVSITPAARPGTDGARTSDSLIGPAVPIIRPASFWQAMPCKLVMTCDACRLWPRRGPRRREDGSHAGSTGARRGRRDRA